MSLACSACFACSRTPPTNVHATTETATATCMAVVESLPRHVRVSAGSLGPLPQRRPPRQQPIAANSRSSDRRCRAQRRRHSRSPRRQSRRRQSRTDRHVGKRGRQPAPRRTPRPSMPLPTSREVPWGFRRPGDSRMEEQAPGHVGGGEHRLSSEPRGNASFVRKAVIRCRFPCGSRNSARTGSAHTAIPTISATSGNLPRPPCRVIVGMPEAVHSDGREHANAGITRPTWACTQRLSDSTKSTALEERRRTPPEEMSAAAAIQHGSAKTGMNGFHAEKSNRCSRQRRGAKATTAAAAKLGDRLASMRRHAARNVALTGPALPTSRDLAAVRQNVWSSQELIQKGDLDDSTQTANSFRLPGVRAPLRGRRATSLPCRRPDRSRELSPCSGRPSQQTLARRQLSN